jgi:peptidoglycan/xylan/chitin deacetylase (PgdA/CDA1 family)
MKPLASLSLDLDNKWSYLKTHGDPAWRSLPSYLDVVVPRVLDFLAARALTITVFVVGQDAALDANREVLAAIPAAGHQIGNHSFHHEPWLHLYSAAQIERELARAEEAIERATGRRPVGFRGPGFSLSPATLQTLARRGYHYDASTLPTFLGPLARAYYFMTARLTPQERRQRKALFGGFAEGLRPLAPYRWRTPAGPVLEIPVTTMPGLRVPIHVSYLLYLQAIAPALALPYFRAALALCRLRGIQPSLLLHPLDFLGADDTRDLDFFPAMRLPSARKLELVGEAVAQLTSRFTVLTLEKYARTLAGRTLPVRELRSAAADAAADIPGAVGAERG